VQSEKARDHTEFFYFGHATRGSTRKLALMGMEGAMEGTTRTRTKGAPRKQRLDNISGMEWVNLPGVQGAGPVAERVESRSTSWQRTLSAVAESRQRILKEECISHGRTQDL